jgi:hypothetical protein
MPTGARRTDLGARRAAIRWRTGRQARGSNSATREDSRATEAEAAQAGTTDSEIAVGQAAMVSGTAAAQAGATALGIAAAQVDPIVQEAVIFRVVAEETTTEARLAAGVPDSTDRVRARTAHADPQACAAAEGGAAGACAVAAGADDRGPGMKREKRDEGELTIQKL